MSGFPAGRLLLCMHHMQEDADWQLAVAVDFPGSKKQQAQLPEVMKLLSPMLSSPNLCKLSCYFEPLLVCLALRSVCLSVLACYHAWYKPHIRQLAAVGRITSLHRKVVSLRRPRASHDKAEAMSATLASNMTSAVADAEPTC